MDTPTCYWRRPGCNCLAGITDYDYTSPGREARTVGTFELLCVLNYIAKAIHAIRTGEGDAEELLANALTWTEALTGVEHQFNVGAGPASRLQLLGRRALPPSPPTP